MAAEYSMVHMCHKKKHTFLIRQLHCGLATNYHGTSFLLYNLECISVREKERDKLRERWGIERDWKKKRDWKRQRHGEREREREKDNHQSPPDPPLTSNPRAPGLNHWIFKSRSEPYLIFQKPPFNFKPFFIKNFKWSLVSKKVMLQLWFCARKKVHV